MFATKETDHLKGEILHPELTESEETSVTTYPLQLLQPVRRWSWGPTTFWPKHLIGKPRIIEFKFTHDFLILSTHFLQPIYRIPAASLETWQKITENFPLILSGELRWHNRITHVIRKDDHPLPGIRECFSRGGFTPSSFVWPNCLYPRIEKRDSKPVKSKLKYRNCLKCRERDTCTKLCDVNKAYVNELTKAGPDIDPRLYIADSQNAKTRREFGNSLGYAFEKSALDYNLGNSDDEGENLNSELDTLALYFGHLPGMSSPKPLTLEEYSRYLLTDKQNRLLWLNDRAHGLGLTFEEIVKRRLKLTATGVKSTTSNLRQIAKRCRDKVSKGLLVLWTEKRRRKYGRPEKILKPVFKQPKGIKNTAYHRHVCDTHWNQPLIIKSRVIKPKKKIIVNEPRVTVTPGYIEFADDEFFKNHKNKTIRVEKTDWLKSQWPFWDMYAKNAEKHN